MNKCDSFRMQLKLATLLFFLPVYKLYECFIDSVKITMALNYLSALWRAFSMICWFIAIPSIISICCFYFGISYYNQCPLDPTIPRNFLIFGVFILIVNIIALILVRNFKNRFHISMYIHVGHREFYQISG